MRESMIQKDYLTLAKHSIFYCFISSSLLYSSGALSNDIFTSMCKIKQDECKNELERLSSFVNNSNMILECKKLTHQSSHTNTDDNVDKTEINGFKVSKKNQRPIMHLIIGSNSLKSITFENECNSQTTFKENIKDIYTFFHAGIKSYSTYHIQKIKDYSREYLVGRTNIHSGFSEHYKNNYLVTMAFTYKCETIPTNKLTSIIKLQDKKVYKNCISLHKK